MPASHSEQMEEAVLRPPTGHPHLCRFWRSPRQVQVSGFTCHPALWPPFFFPCHAPRHSWDPRAIDQIVASFLSLAMSRAEPPPVRTPFSWDQDLVATQPQSILMTCLPPPLWSFLPPPEFLVSSRFLVFPILGKSLQAALDDNPKHVISVRSVFQIACRLVCT